MPSTEVLFYRNDNGVTPVLEWLQTLKDRDQVGYAKCVARIERLAEAGHELRRPEADFLRDGIYELRAKHKKVQYRILYFFHGKGVAVLAHSITKKGDEVPPADIDRAIERRDSFMKDPEAHTYEE